jgi:hypothetical protein
VDEPYTIDSYMPIHIVDSLIRSVQAPPLVVHFDPSWWHTLNINGEDEIEMFYNIAVPNILETIYYPIELNFVSSFGLESLKRRIYYEMK